jgi:hypothetical protein
MGDRMGRPQRLTFLSHFCLCLACAAGAFFAWRAGVLQTIYANDMSMMTSVIAALFVGSAVYLGWQAWIVDGVPRWVGLERRHWGEMGVADGPKPYPHATAEYGHLAERLCVMAGFVGTAIGLSLQAKSLAGGATSFTALATSLYTTACGGTAAAAIAILTYSLEAGLKRARQ